jgi:hypothetical protein
MLRTVACTLTPRPVLVVWTQSPVNPAGQAPSWTVAVRVGPLAGASAWQMVAAGAQPTAHLDVVDEDARRAALAPIADRAARAGGRRGEGRRGRAVEELDALGCGQERRGERAQGDAAGRDAQLPGHAGHDHTLAA